MSKNLRLLLIALVLGVLLAACAPAAAPTEVATEAATEAVTEVPTEVATEAPYDGLSLSADCAASGSEIKEIAAVDKYTLKVTLCRPDPAFLSKIALPSFSVQPRAYVESTGGEGDILEKPIGTGPFKLDTWARGDSITMTRFDDYWGDKAKAATLVFRWQKESAARLTDLQSGTVDGIDNVGKDDMATIQADSTLALFDRIPLTIFYLGMTNTHSPWDKKEVRQAIAQGIDRKRIADNFFPPGSEFADYFTPCEIANGCQGDPWYAFDKDAAKKLLSDAGFPDGFKTKIYYRDVVRPYLGEPGPIAQEIQKQLKDNLNIDAEIQVVDSSTFIKQANNGELDGLFLLGWTADYPHITNFLDAHFSAGVATFGTPYDDITSLLTEGAQLASDKAADVYTKANNAVKDEVPMVPIVHSISAVAYKADVKDAYASPLSSEQFFTMTPGDRDTFVWEQNAEPGSLFCNDESDGEAIRACQQMVEPLYNFKPGTTEVIPWLAESCDPNADLTEWTCHLRQGVKFHDGSELEANDVAASWIAMWDASNPSHKGTGDGYYYMDALFGVINKPQ